MPPAVYLLVFEGFFEKIQPAQQSLPTVPVEQHIGAILSGYVSSNEFFQRTVVHDTPCGGVVIVLFQVIAIFAVQVAHAGSRLGYQIQRTGERIENIVFQQFREDL